MMVLFGVGVTTSVSTKLALPFQNSVTIYIFNISTLEIESSCVVLFWLCYVLDYGMDGQLGISRETTDNEDYSDGQHSSVPCLMENFLYGSASKADLKVSSVKAGGMTSLAIDSHGTLWMWGKCPQQNDTEESSLAFVNNYTPTPVRDIHGHTVVKVACGNEHIVAVVSVGEIHQGKDLACYSWGNNNHGQLGLGDTDNRAHPQVVDTFNRESTWKIHEVACGAFHTALLTHRKTRSGTLQSLCWTFGLGDKGQLGHGTSQNALYPIPVKELPEDVNLISVECGLFHTSVVSSAGDVWSWGMEKGLGICPEASYAIPDTGDALSPVLFSRGGQHQSRFPNPVQVACGAAHTVLIAEDGFRLWSWGRGRNGVLGTGNTVDCYAPTIVLWPPAADDFKQEELKDSVEELKNLEEGTELEQKLSMALKEMNLLQSKLSGFERYASILHGSIFGKPFEAEDMPASLQSSGTFDIANEWENMLDTADYGKLVRLEMFYRNMVRGVKDKMLKRRIQEIMKESLQRGTPRN